MATEWNNALADKLNQLLATETRGLSRHLREATPYLTASTYPIWGDVQQMLAASAEHARTISQLLSELELSEQPQSFTSDVAVFHFNDLEHLLPLLIDEKRLQIAAYQRAIEHANQSEVVNQKLQPLRDENQAQLDQLERHHLQITRGSGLAHHG